LNPFKYFILFLGLSFIFQAQLKPYIPDRLFSVSEEIKEHKPEGVQTSSGIRMEMYKNVLLLIRNAPIFGSGVGSLELEYAKLAESKNTTLKKVTNPHNQYLLTLVETGMLGFVSFLVMLYFGWKISLSGALRNESLISDYMQGLLIAFAIGCLFNSLLLDAGEGRFFCLMYGLFSSAYLTKGKRK
jgi:O-antigen ligase